MKKNEKKFYNLLSLIICPWPSSIKIYDKAIAECCRLNIDYNCEFKKRLKLKLFVIHIIFVSTPFICLGFYECHCLGDWRTEKKSHIDTF